MEAGRVIVLEAGRVRVLEAGRVRVLEAGRVRVLEARVYNGERTVSSISGAGKTGQLHVKE